MLKTEERFPGDAPNAQESDDFYAQTMQEGGDTEFVGLESLGSGKNPDYVPQGQPIIVRAKDDKELSALIATLRRDYGFCSERPILEGGPKGPNGGGCPWIFANIEGHSFWRGKAGVCYARPVFNRWISPHDFLTILEIVYGSAKIEVKTKSAP